MVKKLLKHEFNYYYRTVGLFLPLVLITGAVAKLFSLFSSDSVLIGIVTGLAYTALMLSGTALIVMSVAIGVIRFYKNMYTAEGYLTFTLPVTNSQHIFVKLLLAVSCEILCVLTFIAALFIAFSGELLSTFVEYTSLYLRLIADSLDSVNCIFYTAEAVLILLLSVTVNMLIYFACITFGQTAKKNRILMSFGAYFLFYMASQTVSVVLTSVISVMGEYGALDGIISWSEHHIEATVHISMWLIILYYAALGTAAWILTQKTMTKKLNLE